MKTARFALLLMSLVLAAACGTKGDLVLPEKPATPETPAAPDEPPATEPPAEA
jgi:predicted small lipoprotein YifL